MGVQSAVPRDYLKYNSVVLGVAAAIIIAANADRFGVAVFNSGSALIYIGKDNAVTTGTGFPIMPKTGLYFDGYIGALWAISASASQSAHWMEV